MKILCVAGSRGERAKLAPVIAALEGEHILTCLSISSQGHVPTWDIGAAPAPDLGLVLTESTPVLRIGAVLRWMEFIVEERRPEILITAGGSDAAVAASLAMSFDDAAQAHLDSGIVAPFPAAVNLHILERASTFLLAPHAEAAERLARRGTEDSAFLSGDTLADGAQVAPESGAAQGEPYCLCYLGGQALDSPALPAVFDALARIGVGVLMPAAAEARARLSTLPSRPAPNIRIVEPLDYAAAQEAIARAQLVITDSPTMQREACFRSTVALGLVPPDFPEAERAGWIRPVPMEAEAILTASKAPRPDQPPPVEAHHGSGVRAARFVTGL